MLLPITSCGAPVSCPVGETVAGPVWSGFGGAGGTGVVVPAGESVDLSYTCTFVTQPAYSGTNTATATWADTVPTPSSSAAETVTIAPGGWSETPISSTITVIDDQTDPVNPVTLGVATWNAAGTPQVFTYSLTHEGVPGTCVEFTNTAWVEVTGDDGTDTDAEDAEVEA